MREILFRGKSIDKSYNGEWVYGGIIHQTDFYGDKVDRYYIMDGSKTIDYDIGDREQVAMETIGQFTGLYDKNGNKIFEGDIIKCSLWRCLKVFEVRYYVGEAQFRIKNSGGDYGMMSSAQKTYEVIGNIYDNPELLEDNNG